MAACQVITLEVVHAIRIISGHDKDVHFLKKACSPSGMGVHLAQKRRRTLISRWLIAVYSSLQLHAELCRVRRFASGIAQESSEDRAPLLGLEICDLVIKPVVAARDITKEVVWQWISSVL